MRYWLNHHWDNFPSNASRDGWGTIERGYAGYSLWQLDLPAAEVVDRYREYGRLNASVGLNGCVLNNPNATIDWIEPENLPRIAELADALRAYGVCVYLAVRFDSPMKMGSLSTADPLDEHVRQWWSDTIDTIYAYVPDLGGLLVKGDSEGEPGPLRYHRTHADGANMFAEALHRRGGIVLWRVFVYGETLEGRADPDRAKQADQLFRPLDGEFAENVILQTKHGPWDFQPREPVQPLFGAMPRTNTGIELALSKEYTGHTSHVNYPIAYFERVFSFDTRARGAGTPVSEVVDGSAFGYTRTLAVAVHNLGTDANFTRHPLDQANWYGFGKLAWDPRASASEVAAEWARLSLRTGASASTEVAKLLVESDEVFAKYAQPLGIPFTASVEYHFKNETESWPEANGDTPTGLGYDRTRASGSGYSGLYPEPIARRYENLATTPRDLVLFLHHLRYDEVLPHTGTTLAQAVYDTTFDGVDGIRRLIDRWHGLRPALEHPLWEAVEWLLRRQLGEAINYRNVTNRYVRSRSGVPDRSERDACLRRQPTAVVADQTVPRGGAVTGASSNAAGRVYLLADAWAGIGQWEREDRLRLAADRRTGTWAPVARGATAELRAPYEPGKYRLYAVDEHGTVSGRSSGEVRVTE